MEVIKKTAVAEVRRIWRASYLFLFGLSTASYRTVRGVAFFVFKLKTKRGLDVNDTRVGDIIFVDVGMNDRRPYCVKCEQALMALVVEIV